jgi:hypothetical protein
MNSYASNFANTLGNSQNSNIIAQKQFMNQNSRFNLPPNIRQQISYNQGNSTMNNYNPNYSQQSDQQQVFKHLMQTPQGMYHQMPNQHSHQQYILQQQANSMAQQQLATNNTLTSEQEIEIDNFPIEEDSDLKHAI